MTLGVPVRSTVVLLGVLVGTTAEPLLAQQVSLSPHVTWSPATAVAGLRLDVTETWGGYARLAVRGVVNTCTDSLPPRCNFPEGGASEIAVGASLMTDSSDPWRSRIGMGAGLISWQNESDPFFELSGELGRRLSERLDLVLGLHVLVAPGVERDSSGTEAVVSRRDVTLPGFVLGLSVRPW